MKKAISVGTSAALLASLLATAVAPAVLGAATDYGFTVTGAGSIPTTGTSGAISIAVSETQATGWGAAGNTLTFTINDAAGSVTTVAWSGTPAISGAPGSLGTFTTTEAANVLTVRFTASNIAQIENFSITGLTIDTDGAANGPIDLIVAKTAGAGTGTIATGTGTASGVLDNDEAAGSTLLEVTYDAGSFLFVPTDASNGNLQIAAPDAETRSITSVAAGPDLTVPALTSFHAADTAVTQSVAVAGLLGAPGTVVKTITQTAIVGSAFVQPGENNQVAGSTTLTESSAATFSTNMVVTFTLDTAGVLFSAAPVATPSATMALNSAAVGVGVPCALSFDRTSCSVTVTNDSSVAGTIVLGTISLDLAASVAQGTNIGLNITTSPVAPVVVTSKTIARVGRVLVGVSAQPTIYINENDQQSGMIVLTESRAGVLTDSAGANYFGLCLDASQGTVFTRAPWAVVTAGNITIRSGVVGAASVQGTLVAGTGNRCVEWVVFTKSTTASTIEIRGADAANVVLPTGATNGPRLSVAPSAIPGALQIRVLNGSQVDVEANAAAALVTTVSNAIKAFRNQPVVAAVSQPGIPAGTARAQMGNLTISETTAGQFKAGETITFTLQGNYGPAGTLIPLVFRTGIQADYPIVTTNTASGLLASVTGLTGTAVQITILQQASGSLGVITLGNLWVYSLTAAPAGAVLTRVQSSVAGTTIDQTVSNARIGTAAAGPVKLYIRPWSALGLRPVSTSAYSIKTPKVQVLGKYVTWKFGLGAARHGQRVNVLVATKSGGVWGAFAYKKSAWADANGNVLFWLKSSTAAAYSVRVQWPGNATYGVSTSPALGAYWK